MAMTRKLFAEGTTTSVESSRGEVSGILAKHGVVRQAMASEPEGDTLQFWLGGRAYRLFVKRPTVQDIFDLFPNHRDTDAKVPAKLDAEGVEVRPAGLLTLAVWKENGLPVYVWHPRKDRHGV